MKPIKKSIFQILTGVVLFIVAPHASYTQSTPDYKNQNLNIDLRVEGLLRSLTIEEKISMLGFQSPGVTRLNIPAYNWWNEALHGVARAGKATVYPQAIGLAATFNDSLVQKIADAISTEARAKYNVAAKLNRHEQ